MDRSPTPRNLRVNSSGGDSGVNLTIHCHLLLLPTHLAPRIRLLSPNPKPNRNQHPSCPTPHRLRLPFAPLQFELTPNRSCIRWHPPHRTYRLLSRPKLHQGQRIAIQPSRISRSKVPKRETRTIVCSTLRLRLHHASGVLHQRHGILGRVHKLVHPPLLDSPPLGWASCIPLNLWFQLRMWDTSTRISLCQLQHLAHPLHHQLTLRAHLERIQSLSQHHQFQHRARSLVGPKQLLRWSCPVHHLLMDTRTSRLASISLHLFRTHLCSFLFRFTLFSHL